MTLWQELDLCYDEEWDCPNENVRYMKQMENDSVYAFLAGLNKALDEVMMEAYMFFFIFHFEVFLFSLN